MITKWKVVSLKEIIYTGGNCDYRISIFRKVNKEFFQIEIMEDLYDSENIIVNIGIHFKKNDEYFFGLITNQDGESYKENHNFTNVNEAYEFAHKYMEEN